MRHASDPGYFGQPLAGCIAEDGTVELGVCVVEGTRLGLPGAQRATRKLQHGVGGPGGQGAAHAALPKTS